MTVVNFNPGPHPGGPYHYASPEAETAERVRLAQIQADKIAAADAEAAARHEAALANKAI